MATNDLTEVESTSIVKPIIYGNTAKSFDQKRPEDGHTHEWSIYVRSYVNEDISTWVKKVHFKLHDSYENPTRIVQEPPFEITETGWGEFEVVIKIYFQDTNERPVTLYHELKLHNDGKDSEPSEKTVFSEFYEEIIFYDPSTYMKHLLIDTLSKNPPIHEQYLHYETEKKETLDKIMKARKRVQEQTALYKNRLVNLRKTIDTFQNEIYALQSQCCSSSLN